MCLLTRDHPQCHPVLIITTMWLWAVCHRLRGACLHLTGGLCTVNNMSNLKCEKERWGGCYNDKVISYWLINCKVIFLTYFSSLFGVCLHLCIIISHALLLILGIMGSGIYILIYISYSRLLYCFNSSPAKDLRAINNMLKMGERKALNSLAEKRKNGGDIMEGAPAIKAIKF